MGCLGGCILEQCPGVGPPIVASVRTRLNNSLKGGVAVVLCLITMFAWNVALHHASFSGFLFGLFVICMCSLTVE